MIYLHIGFHKTGSTTLQTYMRDNAQALAQRGVLYPEIGRPAGVIAHHRLAQDVVAGNVDQAEWQAIRTLAEDNPDKAVLISGEGFESANPNKVRALLGDADVKVLVYYRDTPQKFVSSYGHGAREGFHQNDFDTAFESRLEMKRTKSGKILRRWAEAFGGENVRVRSLDTSILIGGDLILDFLTALGLDPINDPIEAEAIVANRSPGWKTLELMRATYKRILPPGLDRTERLETLKLWRGRYIRAAVTAEDALGLNAKANYLTAEQIETCVRMQQHDISICKKSGIDANIKDISVDQFQPRSFMPEMARIPEDEASALLHRMIVEICVETLQRNAKGQARKAAAKAQKKAR